jgi:SEFIR domain/Sel1 repeat/Effector-associated domain 1
MGSSPPKVFISYSHDSTQHRDLVLSFAQRLRRDGVDAQIDQYVSGRPPEGWPRWMLDKLDWAEFVLLICTETFYRRFRGHDVPGTGRGVDWEGQLITMEIYLAQNRTAKFVPVIFTSQDEEFIPELLRDHPYRLDTEQGYPDLYAFLTTQAGIPPEKLGAVQMLQRQQVEALTFSKPGRKTSLTRALLKPEARVAAVVATYDGPRRKRLRAALLEQFPKRSDLAILLDDTLSQDLDATVNSTNQTDATFELTKWLWIDVQGRLKPFLAEAMNRRPNAAELKALYVELFEQALEKTAAENRERAEKTHPKKLDPPPEEPRRTDYGLGGQPLPPPAPSTSERLDQDKARECERAANAGDVIAMLKLGEFYENGLGVEQNYGKAAEWYQKGANAGNEKAMDLLGELYYNGLGVAKDHTKASFWFKKSGFYPGS